MWEAVTCWPSQLITTLPAALMPHSQHGRLQNGTRLLLLGGPDSVPEAHARSNGPHPGPHCCPQPAQHMGGVEVACTLWQGCTQGEGQACTAHSCAHHESCC